MDRDGAVSPGLADSTAVVGVGQTEFSKAAGRSETQLASEAIVAALQDAGISVAEVDGLVSYTIDPVEETELVRGLGILEIGFSSRVPYGGGDRFGCGRGRGALPRHQGALRCPVRTGQCRWFAHLVALWYDRDAVVLALRSPDSGGLDVAQCHALHARLRRHE